MTRTLTVGISDCIISKDQDAVLATHALGSCIAVLIYDPLARVGGMLHYMLPSSGAGADGAKGVAKPFMYADTGIPLLFRTAYQAGASKERLIVTALGGAQVIQSEDSFNIGKRNHLAMRKILWKSGVMVHHEEVGGTAPRTVHFEIGSGRIVVSSGREQHAIPQGDSQRRMVQNGV
jgi:chemotaxis protein CheD